MSQAQTIDDEFERLKEVALTVDAATYLKSIRNSFRYPSHYCGHRYGANIQHCPKCGPGFELSVRKGESKFQCTKCNRIDGRFHFESGPRGSTIDMVMHLDDCDEPAAIKKLAEFAEANGYDDSAASGSGSIAKFPTQEKRLYVPQISPDVVDAIYSQGKWKDIAEWLSDQNVKTWYSWKMHQFVDDVRSMKKRPSTAQLGLLIGLAINVQLQMAIDDIERPEREAEAAMREEIEKEVRQRMAEKKSAEAGESNVVPLQR